MTRPWSYIPQYFSDTPNPVWIGMGLLGFLLLFQVLRRRFLAQRQKREARNIIMNRNALGSIKQGQRRRLILPAGVLAALLAANGYFYFDRVQTALSPEPETFAGTDATPRVIVNRRPQIKDRSGSPLAQNRPSGFGHATIKGIVTHVRDGDTIEVAGTPIRLAHLDCPELGTAAGETARDIMTQMVNRQLVECALNGERSYDRLIGLCRFPDGQPIEQDLIWQGVCAER